jgi:hypothetical protein
MKKRLFRAVLYTLSGLGAAFVLGTCPPLASLGVDALSGPASPRRRPHS